MILGDNELAWETKVVAAAYANRWSVFRQEPSRRSQDQRAPSLVLARGDRVLAVFLRLRVRIGRQPVPPPWAVSDAVEAVTWTPEMWSAIVRELRSKP